MRKVKSIKERDTSGSVLSQYFSVLQVRCSLRTEGNLLCAIKPNFLSNLDVESPKKLNTNLI